MLSSYEGQNVFRIEIAGQPNLNTSLFQGLYAQKEGEPFSKQKVDQTAAAIQARGKYQTVRIEVSPASKGVLIQFIPEPAVYLGIFQFPGARRFPYSRLLQVANYPIQTPYSVDTIERDRQKLLAFFREEGYFQADVGSRFNVDSAHALANVEFPTTLGRRSKFGNVVIAGLPNDEQHHLEESLKAFLARLRSAAIRAGKPYHPSTLRRATQYLQAQLEKKGFPGAQVELAGAEYHADTNRADIHFSVNTGPKAGVKIEGAHLWSWTQKRLLPVEQGAGVDQASVQEGQQALESYFQSKGYFEVKVDARTETGPKGDTIIYQIVKDKKHSVESIRISGNKHLDSSQLMPHVAVEKEHLLSHGKFSDQLLRTSVENLVGVYKSEGYSNVKVVPTVVHKGGDVYVSFAVTEGPRDIVESLRIEGADTFPASEYAPHGLEVVAGQPYSSNRVVADRASIIANYLRAGYLTASFRESASGISKSDPHHIDVIYHIYEGPKVATGEILTLGRTHTQQKLIEMDANGIRQEAPLTETQLLTTETRLYDHSGVFDWAEVDPKRPITTQNNEDVLIKVHEGPRNTMNYGFGFEVINRGGSIPSGTVALPNLPPIGLPSNFTTSQTTFYGPRGTFQYTRNNLRGKGETASFTAFAGRLRQQAAIYYIDPTFHWSPWRANTTLSYEKNEENPIFSSQQEEGTLQFQRYVDRAKKDIVFFQYSYSHTNLTRVLISALVPAQDRNIRLSTLSANITRDTRDNPLDEHRGVLDSLEVDFNSSNLGSNVDFAKLTGQAAFYKQKFHNIVWADSIRIGLAQPFNGSFVPLSEAFFTGGGNSLRGFPLDGAGPQNSVQICPNGTPSCSNPAQIRVPAGGNELLLLNSEARIPLPIKKGLTIVPFYDGGNVFPRIGFHDFTSLYSNNVGIGLRYETPVGPIRFDLGQNLNPVSGISSTQYFVSIGQAF